MDHRQIQYGEGPVITQETRIRSGWALSFLLALPATLVAQQPANPPAPTLEPYQVGQAMPPAEPGRTVIALSLEQAIERALEMNLDMQSARLTPQMQDYSLEAAEAAFLPTFNSNFGYNNSSNVSTSQLDGGARTTTQRNTLNMSVAQTVPWYGGRLTTNFNNSRTETNNAFTTRNPSFSSSVSLNYTQPLLSGLRTDNQRTALVTQQIQRQIVDIQLSSQIQNLTDQVRVAYWNLRSQIEQIEIQRRSLAQAEQLLANNRIRVQLGSMAEIELFQAEAQVASAQQALLNAQIQWTNQEMAFKRLLVNGPDDPLLQQTVNPIDQLPSFEQLEVDIDAAIEVALRDRTDIRQQRQTRQVAELNLEVTRDGARPDLNLTAGYSLSGVGGDLFDRSGLGGAPQLVQEGGYMDGLRSIAEFDTPTWNVGVTFSYPLGMKAARASLDRAELQLRQSDLALRSQELAITTEVTNAGLAVRNTYLQLEAARRTRAAAERSAEAELRKFGVGVSTNFQVVQVQNSLTSSRLSELRAMINYINAIAEFERVQRVGR
jgi:outer membrane protein TolC